jgi:hypothetical protein
VRTRSEREYPEASERRENNMTKKILLLGLVSILAGCGEAPIHTMRGGGGTPGDPCPHPVCKVKITVSGNCNVVFDPPDHMYVAADNRNMLIQWDLDGATFIDDQSIYLKKPGANNPPDLTSFTKAGNQKFTVHNAHTVVGKHYEYGVRVNQNGNVCDTHPWIDN